MTNCPRGAAMPYLVKLLPFLLLSAADFALTEHLIRRGLGYEANPVAAWFLEGYGWSGITREQAIAATLVNWSMEYLPGDEGEVAHRARELREEFEAAYHHPLPEAVQVTRWRDDAHSGMPTAVALGGPGAPGARGPG